MNLQEKENVVAQLSETIKGCSAAFLVDYKGCDTASLTRLRKELRPEGGRIEIVKNTLLKRAIAGTPADAFGPYLEGPTALIWSDVDPVSPAKAIAKFKKTNVNFEVKAGYVEGNVVDANGVEQLASLPSKEELYATLLALINAPAQQLLRMVNAPAATLVRLVEAWRVEIEKKG